MSQPLLTGSVKALRLTASVQPSGSQHVERGTNRYEVPREGPCLAFGRSHMVASVAGGERKDWGKVENSILKAPVGTWDLVTFNILSLE